MMKSRMIFLLVVMISGMLLITVGCKKDKDKAKEAKDIDGYTYKTVTIRDQVWMAENLRVTRLRDGTSIPLVESNNGWYELTTPGYCWYSNAEGTNKAVYGALYNWYTVNTGKLCPEGWRIPSNNDWISLEKHLGMDPVMIENNGYRGEDENIGGRMKQTGTTLWNPPNAGATNETGFNGLPGGSRNLNGDFLFLKEYGLWWTSTAIEMPGFAIMRALIFDQQSVFRNDYDKRNGFSVRCIRE